MNTLIAACWKDDALKQRFLSDPHAVLAEHGMDVPEGINVNVVENTDNTVHVTLPAAPTANGDLSDEELENSAGGAFLYPSNHANNNSNITHKDGVTYPVFWDTNPGSPGFPVAN